MHHVAILSALLLLSCQEKQPEKTNEFVESKNVWAESKSVSVLMNADLDPFVAVNEMNMDEVKALLTKMHTADQQYRDSLQTGNPDRMNYYGEKMIANDQANKKLLDKIIAQYGWPGIGQFGEAGSQAAWYVAWHQRNSERSMAFYIEHMEKANRKHDMHQEQFLLVKNQLAHLRSVGKANP